MLFALLLKLLNSRITKKSLEFKCFLHNLEKYTIIPYTLTSKCILSHLDQTFISLTSFLCVRARACVTESERRQRLYKYGISRCWHISRISRCNSQEKCCCHVSTTTFYFQTYFANCIWQFNCSIAGNDESVSSKFHAVLAELVRTDPDPIIRDKCVRIIACLMGQKNHKVYLQKVMWTSLS